MMKKWLIGGVVLLAVGAFVFAVISVIRSDPYGGGYAKLLKAQGYVPLKHPRSDFGVGTIVPVDSDKNLFIAGQDECFPDLEKSFEKGTTKLIDGKDYEKLSISASGNFTRTGASSFLSKVAAALGYTDSSIVAVKFGETSSVNLTEVGLQKYLVGHKIASVCVNKLRDPKNAVIFSMARVSGMTYSFSGQKGANASVSPDALKSTMAASGVVSFDHTQEGSVTITSPLYVGYNAFSLADLQIEAPESGTGGYVVSSVNVTKTKAKLPN